MHKSIHGTENSGAFYQFQNTLFHVKQNLFQYQMLVILLKFLVCLKCDFYFPFSWTTGRNVLKVHYIVQDNYQFTQNQSDFTAERFQISAFCSCRSCHKFGY